jgi:YegS/Rv2252/BmrU family lipid kinase
LHRREQLLREIETVFNGYTMQCYFTTESGHASILTAEAITAGATEVIAVGGDGTLNEVINGIMTTAITLPPGMQRINVSVYPKGTGNDFAKSIRMPADLQILKRCIDTTSLSLIDVGIAYYTNRKNHAVSRYFINITDLGMGGVIAEKLAGYSKWMGAYLSFQRAIISTLIGYKKQLVTIHTNETKDAGEMMNVVVANGKYFGSGLGIAPDASLDDGSFSVITIGDISLMDYLRLLGKVRKCQKVDHSQVKYMQANEIRLDAPQGPLPIDMDGEFVGYSPLKIKVIPGALSFRIP